MTAMTEPSPPVYGAAAEAYWRCNWRSVLPLPPGQKANPPTGYSGSTSAVIPSFADVMAWIEDRPTGNIALRLPPTVVGIDVDAYDGRSGAGTLWVAEKDWGPLPPTVRSTSRGADDPSGIRFFRIPEGTVLRGGVTRSDGALGNVDIIQSGHRYAVVWPSRHPEGGTYQWLDAEGQPCGIPTVDSLPELPQRWVDELRAADPKLNPDAGQWNGDLTEGEESAHVRIVTETAIADLRTGVLSRHDTTTKHVLHLLRLAEQGEIGVRTGLRRLEASFVAAVTSGAGHVRTDAQARREFARMVTGTRGRSLIASTPSVSVAEVAAEDLGQPEESEPEPDIYEIEGDFWGTRPELITIMEAAFARMCSPWAVFGAVLARAIAAVPPWVTLPATIGGPGSLNLFVGLVAPSGGGKGAATAVARELLPLPDGVLTAELGSGEGIARTFATRNAKGDLEWHTKRVLFTLSEIDSLGAVAGRQGATLMPKLRAVYSGEEPGFGYADPKKRVLLGDHSYRATLVAGVQPERAGFLLGETSGGTPQRFIWLPATDSRIHEDRPAFPHQLALHEFWDCYERTMDYPPEVASFVIGEHVKRARGEGDALDGHSLFTRAKVAAGLAILNGRGFIDHEDWELSATVMAISDRQREIVVAAVAKAEEAEAERRGELTGVERYAADSARDLRRIEQTQRLQKLIVKWITDKGPMTLGAMRRAAAGRDRPLVADAVSALVTADLLVCEGDQFGLAGENDD